MTYFPALSDTETADPLREWCERQGIEPTLREGKTELGEKIHSVILLLLMPS